MISLKGVLLGIALSFAGSVIYLAYWIRIIMQHAPQPTSEGVVGIDIISTIKMVMIHNPGYWLLVLVLMAAGLRHRLLLASNGGLDGSRTDAVSPHVKCFSGTIAIFTVCSPSRIRTVTHQHSL
jgi:hypothetical protein